MGKAFHQIVAENGYVPIRIPRTNVFVFGSVEEAEHAWRTLGLTYHIGEFWAISEWEQIEKQEQEHALKKRAIVTN